MDAHGLIMQDPTTHGSAVLAPPADGPAVHAPVADAPVVHAPDGPATRGASMHALLPQEVGCRVREVLERVGDKWSVYVICQLGDGPKRFTELRKGVEGISQRMLTVTLRGLERDGLLSRHVYPVVPPRVEYTLTPLGRTLLCTVAPVLAWAAEHLHDIDVARVTYDSRPD